MCRNVNCSHAGEGLCACAPVTTGDPKAMAVHMLQNMRGLKMELEYETLEAPAPSRFCASGSCKVCGGRLCLGVELPGDLRGDGFLTVLHHHMKRLGWDDPGRFAALFHEEDRPAVQRWLEQRDDFLPEYGATIYTIIQSGADSDRGLFPDPAARGSYWSLASARDRLAELITEEKAKLDSRYDTEKSLDDCWEMYQDGYEGHCFTRLEIVPSVLEKGGPHDE